MTVICGASFDSRLPAASREICTCYKLRGYPPTSPLTSRPRTPQWTLIREPQTLLRLRHRQGESGCQAIFVDNIDVWSVD
ncbi:hypothetical protein C351_01808 [Cryptococcus neoformans c8]|nr:hypothetical protein C353_02213 [Cryptococcus neoformans var. grubii AD1-83a]OXG63325.1 hypothetical protein C354_02149 [Cryptococcus neoformans var. grubii MW-RSA1955]OXG66470.1 hypothetical protein C351_01808 [Cryptococcus neoformans var. grubii c8]OXG68184.1 hypothetical protein C352_02154 [Cryptococcus neoformans var. grubii CHC193]OXH14000.1 hypothetical protein C369_02194 [Cryptococcus neoformans var. grubii A5-35-17]OXH15101.1 hypothetical protein C370_02205 [Cryptococcus neoformans 